MGYKFIGILFLKLFFFQIITAQNLLENNLLDYFDEVNRNAIVFSGKEQTKYPLNIKNSPYYNIPEHVKIKLLYDDIFYYNVQIKLDTYKDELVILEPQNTFGLVVNPEYFSYLEIEDYFIYYQSDINDKLIPFNGYYVLKYSGNICKFFIKPSCEIKQVQKGGAISSYFQKKEYYYLEKENEFFLIKNKKTILNLFLEHKKELDQFIKYNNLNYKANPVKFIIEVLKQLEGL